MTTDYHAVTAKSVTENVTQRRCGIHEQEDTAAKETTRKDIYECITVRYVTGTI